MFKIPCFLWLTPKSIDNVLLFLGVLAFLGLSFSCTEEDSFSPDDPEIIITDTLTEQQEPDSVNNQHADDQDQEGEEEIETDDLDFLALGDSYTIGQGVTEEERWPAQLVEQLKAFDIYFDELNYIAQTGWTTGNLKSVISQQNPKTNYDLVSLLIGVNNQYRGYDIDIFREEFEELLNIAIAHANGNKERVIVVSIPDYGVTPFGGYSDKITKEIDEYNSIKKAICDRYGIKYFYITDISRKAENDLSYLASDKLHPSGKMYKEWVEYMDEEIAALF